MRVQYMSDLHLEFTLNQEYIHDFFDGETGDILLLAGDIMYLKDSIFIRRRFLTELSHKYSQVLIVPGNHEFYAYNDIKAYGDSWQIELRPNIHYYYNKVVHIGDTDFILSTLWSKLDLLQEKRIQQGMSDFYQIGYNGEWLTPRHYNEEHDNCVRFIREAVEKSTADKIVVVTHHAPSLQTVAPQHQNSILRSAFSSDLEELIKNSRIDYWVYGHSHTNIDCQVGQTKIICNQLGYVSSNEHLGFNYNKFFEI